MDLLTPLPHFQVTENPLSPLTFPPIASGGFSEAIERTRKAHEDQQRARTVQLTLRIDTERQYTLHMPRGTWLSSNKRPTYLGYARDDQLARDYHFYFYNNRCYFSEIHIPPIDIPLILHKDETSRKEKLARELERLKAQAEARQKPRQPIPEKVQLTVWQRDSGECVKCGSTENLEFDYIIPISKGGSSTARNVQLLCQECNRSKSNNVGA